MKVTPADLHLIRRLMHETLASNPNLAARKLSKQRLNWDLANLCGVDLLLLQRYPFVDHDRVLAHVMHNEGHGAPISRIYGPTCTLGNVLTSVKRSSRYVDGR